MTKRQSSLERLGNFKVMIDDTTDEIVGLVDAHGNERKLVTAVSESLAWIHPSAAGSAELARLVDARIRDIDRAAQHIILPPRWQL